jgi:hypothetical protein
MSLVPDHTFCLVCMKKVLETEKGLQCENKCLRWFHAACVNVSDSEYRKLSADNNRKWFCARYDCIEPNNHPLSGLLSRFETMSTQMATIISKLDILTTVPADISAIKNELANVNEKLDNIEPRIVSSEIKIKALEDEVQRIKNSNSSSNVEQVVEEINDRERRSRNVIIYNLPESTSVTLATRIDHDKNLVSKLTSKFCSAEYDSSFKLYRIGRTQRNKTRPLKVVFNNTDPVFDLCKRFDQKALSDLD